jgi:hypothetical protein
MAEYSFSEEAIQGAIKAAQASHDDAIANNKLMAVDISNGVPMQPGTLVVGAECISVTVENGKICINLPLGIGKYCFTIPSKFPSGTVGQACLSICTKWKIPTGVKVTVAIAGVTVINQSFGAC